LILYDIFRCGHGVFFVVLQTTLMFGFFLEWIRDRRACALNAAGSEPPDGGGTASTQVSVIIPIHNESRRMEGLLRSLLCQDYPAEIIFVDDRSTDESPGMLARFVKDAAERSMGSCRIITLKENPGLNHKQYALSRGIAESKGEFLLFTDGDCEVSPGWIRAMVRRMADVKTGAVIGPVFKKKQGRGFFYLYQCYDHAIRYNYLAGAIGLGAAGGGFGNNLIVSRRALEAAGGYDAVPPSPTEDAALISQIRSLGEYRVRAIAQPDAAVETGAEHSWKSFISQTLRWNNGGLFSPDPVTRLNYNVLMLVISTGTLALLLLPFFPGLWPLPLGVFIVMIENTVAAFGLFRKKLPRGGPAYFLTLLFTPVYFTLMTLMGYCGINVTWKGEKVAPLYAKNPD
jgi:cellulose synthase/poly-beta-1,6-N-acetylglucosamine synthase-like glycosyltransferase